MDDEVAGASAEHNALIERVRAVAAFALATIERSRQRLDDLNVYPVPDGDTGRNMTATVAAVRQALVEHRGDGPADLIRAVKHAALMGAKGNSGIILSQILRGAADALGQVRRFDGHAVALALRGATDAAYTAVSTPVEGTILTVVREMAEEAEAAADETLTVVFDRVLARGEDALRRTPELLQVLRDAGVVDAGGAGLLEVVRGAVAALRGEELPAVESTPGGFAVDLDHAHAEPSRYRYCTNVLARDVDPERFRTALAEIGDSLVVVGDRELVKAHVHADDPGRALSIVVELGGAIAGIDVGDMHEQIVERAERLARPAEHRACDVVFVGVGEGVRVLAESLGARVIVSAGQTSNPSTADLLAAIDRCDSDEVVLLPNNPNVLLAAQAAAREAGRPVAVVPTRSIQAGLAALIAYLPDRTGEANATSMVAAAGAVRTGEITRAVRDARVDGVDIRAGQVLSLMDDVVVASHDDLGAAVGSLFARLIDDEREYVSVLVGDDASGGPEALAAIEIAGRSHPDVELEINLGGQPHYALLLAAE